METTREAELFARVRALEALAEVVLTVLFRATEEESTREFLDCLRERIERAVDVPVPEQGRTPAEIVELRMQAIEYWIRLPLTGAPDSSA